MIAPSVGLADTQKWQVNSSAFDYSKRLPSGGRFCFGVYMSIERRLRILARCIIIDIIAAALSLVTQHGTRLWIMLLDVGAIAGG